MAEPNYCQCFSPNNCECGAWGMLKGTEIETQPPTTSPLKEPAPAVFKTEIKHDEDLIEHLYWEFDNDRKSRAERGEFKSSLRQYASKVQRDNQPVWQTMETAPKDGTAILVILSGSDIPQAARWMKDTWCLIWDHHDVAPDVRLWMPILQAAVQVEVNKRVPLSVYLVEDSKKVREAIENSVGK